MTTRRKLEFFSIVQNSPLQIAATADRFKWDGNNYRNHKPAKAVRRPDLPSPLDSYRVDRETDKKNVFIIGTICVRRTLSAFKECANFHKIFFYPT